MWVALKIAIYMTNHFSTDQEQFARHRNHARLFVQPLEAVHTSFSASKVEQTANVVTVSSIFPSDIRVNAKHHVRAMTLKSAVDLIACLFGKTLGLGYVEFSVTPREYPYS
jgi:hypothetical protein